MQSSRITDPVEKRFVSLILRFFAITLILIAVAACSPSAPASLTADPSPAAVSLNTPTVTRTAIQKITTLTPAILPATRTVLPTRPQITYTPSPTATQPISSTLVLGRSTQGWPVEAYRFGTGPVHLALIGGIHGGYEWNTILLAYKAIDYFGDNPMEIPAEISLYIIPSANPDGQIEVVGHSGRFSADEVGKDTISGRTNAQGVDLNRNWDCKWEPNGFWRNEKVSGGKKPFSEPETQTLRDFLTRPPMAAVVFWHSAVPAVYAGGCDGRYAPSDALGEIYADAAGYQFELSFTGYPVTGAAVDWLASQGVPAIEVELTNHRNLDWDQNLKAITELLITSRRLEGRPTVTPLILPTTPRVTARPGATTLPLP